MTSNCRRRWSCACAAVDCTSTTPSRQTALVVIDMQVAFLGEGGPSEVPAAALQN